MKTSAAKIAGSSLWLSSGFVFSRCLQLVAQIVLARLLLAEDFGVWALVLVLTNLSTLFRDGAIAQVLIQKGLDDKRLVDAVYSLGINISVGLFILQTLVGFPLARFFDAPIVWPLSACAGIVFLIGAGAGSHGAVLGRQMRFKELALCNALAGVARFSGTVACAVAGGGVWAFVAGEVAMAVVDSVLKRALSGYRFTYHLFPDPIAIREVRGFIAGILGVNLAVQVNTNSDNLVVGRLLGTADLGYYNVAYQLAMLPVFVLSQINRVNFSVLARLENEARQAYVCRALELCALLSAPVYGVAFVCAPWAIPWLYGPDWLEAVVVFQTVLVFAYARGFMGILGTALNVLNKPGTNAFINWVLVPLSIPAYLVGAWLGGTTGVAIAVVAVMGVGATLWFWLATCRAAGWPVGIFVQPVMLPTLAIGVTVAWVFLMPLRPEFQYTQPFAVLSIYAALLSLFSLGRIPQMLASTLKHALGLPEYDPADKQDADRSPIHKL
ncbi:MAG: oligosaccharide flippase family protein [Gemmatimonadaceae bacterium]|nr:oligosaccharide flippase family protein [Gloeobacterales cyanobacterium ES-bin-141]